MTAVDPGMGQEAPKMLPAKDPRPIVETLRGWPFAVLAVGAVAVLGGVTIIPGLLAGEPEIQYDNQPPSQSLAGNRRPLATTPDQIPQTVQQSEPKAQQAPAPTEGPKTAEVRVIQNNSGGRQNTGPTRAELLKMARMSDLKPVGMGSSSQGGGVTQAGFNGGSGGGGNNGPSGKLYNPHSLTPAFDCQVDAGTNIPAMTEQRLTSESPGTVSAITMRDVWSSDKQCLAIPRGTRFVGNYQTAVAEGQARMGIIWSGLTRPAPRKDTIELVNTVAGDPDGTAGVSGEVNNFFWRKLAYVAAASILDIGKTAVTASGDGGVGAAVAGIFVNRASSPIDEWARRQLDIPPVIEVEPREISIVLAQHLPMDEFRAGR